MPPPVPVRPESSPMAPPEATAGSVGTFTSRSRIGPAFLVVDLNSR